MTKNDSLPVFLAGLGIGAAVGLLFVPASRGRLGTRVRMGDVTDKLKDKIDRAADATKKVVEKVADKSTDAAHQVGERLQQEGKRLQKV